MASKLLKSIEFPFKWLRSKFTHETYCPTCAACAHPDCCGKRCTGALSCADYEEWHERDGVASAVLHDCCPPQMEQVYFGRVKKEKAEER